MAPLIHTQLLMEYKDFSQETWTEIEKVLSGNGGSRIAAFDADGTLWDTDLGEMFFSYQIKNCGLKNLPSDPWNHYHTWKETDPRGAYLWLAQINAGRSLQQVRDWSLACFNENRKEIPIFPAQKKLVSRLQEKGFEVFVVTASIKWAVEPAALHLYGIDYDHVIGIETAVDSTGIVTTDLKGVITWREGKVEGLLEKTKGQKPVLCSGNTTGDLFLLESGEKIQLAVRAAPRGSELFETEEHLYQEARRRNWLTHRFTDE